MIEQILVWLWRIGRCRGFGIQSPWAYDFVRKVVNERLPYYAYEEFTAEEKLRGATRIEKKKGRLMFRIANFVQADRTCLAGESVNGYETYLKRGCNKSKYVSCECNKMQYPSSECDKLQYLSCGCNNSSVEHVENTYDLPTMTLVGVEAATTEWIDKVAAQMSNGSVIIIDNIGRNKEARRLWKHIVGELPQVITFDLYYCGVVYKDSKRFKQNYIVNF